MGNKRSKKSNRLAKQLKEIEQLISPVAVPVTEGERDFHSEKKPIPFFSIRWWPPGRSWKLPK